jgi:hypothetical protein
MYQIIFWSGKSPISIYLENIQQILNTLEDNMSDSKAIEAPCLTNYIHIGLLTRQSQIHL